MRRCSPLLGAVLLLAPPAAWAGPPYVTDDPQPTDVGHWEIYNFVDGDHAPGVTAGEAPQRSRGLAIEDLDGQPVVHVADITPGDTGRVLRFGCDGVRGYAL